MQKQGQAKVRDAVLKRMGKVTQGGNLAARNTQPRRRAAQSPLGNDTLGSRSDSFLFDDRDTDLPLLSIARLVAKVKNASRKAKPFRALMERPDAVAFRQQAHQPPNQIIDPARVFRLTCLVPKQLVGQTIPLLELSHVHEAGPLIEKIVAFERGFVAARV